MIGLAEMVHRAVEAYRSRLAVDDEVSMAEFIRRREIREAESAEREGE